MLMIFTMIFVSTIMNYPWNLQSCGGIGFNSTVGNSTGNNLIGAIPACDVALLSWWPGYLLIMLYVALYIRRSHEPGRTKFVYMAFVGMMVSWLMVMFQLFIPPLSGPSIYVIPTAATGAFFLIYIWVNMTHSG